MQASILGMKALETRARHEAQRRGQIPSTAHLLLVMLHAGDDATRLLLEHGVREAALLAAIREVEAEPTSALERVLERAARTARETGARAATPLHALSAVCTDERTRAYRCLVRLGAEPGRVHQATRTGLGLAIPTPIAPKPPEPRPMPRPLYPTGGARRHLAMAKRKPPEPEAKPGGAGPASPMPVATQATPAPSTAQAPRRNVRVEPKAEPRPKELGPLELDPERFPLLCSLGRNLTALAASGRIDPVVGREREIDSLLDVLARRRSNNPILVGPPGVGKTSVVEGLSLELARGGQGVNGLEGRIVIEVSAGSLVSGTGVRGALSDRIRKLRDEVVRAEGRVVLFIDEIHAIVGGEGPDDLGHELKAALARGELPCIGATTDAEYRKHFEKDAALARRFSPIAVDEPTPEATLGILRGIAPTYESHHGVAIARDGLEAAVELSVRFLPERKLPDKAISVVDLAAARVRRRGGETVDRKAVASVIAEQARVPLDRLLLRDADRLLDLERLLGERVVGHAGSMGRIADALRKGAAGFRGKRPLSTFLFLGPTGVGKTETAKAVSDVFFAGSPMTRFDMSEFSEAHAVARLFGAPPGYVGHDEGGQLTEAVRRRPYQLVLLDEIEKAHPDVLLALLPLLDEGRLTDGKGRTVDFTNTILVLTSNLGAHAPEEKRRSIGFGAEAPRAATEAGTRVLEAARRSLPPELWNRIDEPLYFGALSSEEVAEIARRMLASVAGTLRTEHGISLEVDESAIETLVRAGGFDATLGARPMKRTIGRLVEARLASAVLGAEIRRGDAVRLVGEGDAIAIARESRLPDAAE
ncbi:MAG: ATP-dependent Clp protease ATP-binding subunit [Polyangiales bacterium]